MHIQHSQLLYYFNITSVVHKTSWTKIKRVILTSVRRHIRLVVMVSLKFPSNNAKDRITDFNVLSRIWNCYLFICVCLVVVKLNFDLYSHFIPQLHTLHSFFHIVHPRIFAFSQSKVFKTVVPFKASLRLNLALVYRFPRYSN
jgi:hypothetical protein